MVTVFKLVPAVDMRLFCFFLTVHYSDHCCPLWWLAVAVLINKHVGQ